MSVLAVLNFLTEIFAILAAAAWIHSSRVVALYMGPAPKRIIKGGQLPEPALRLGVDADGNQIDLIPTVRLQSQWSGYAAWMAAVAALWQAACAMVEVLS